MLCFGCVNKVKGKIINVEGLLKAKAFREPVEGNLHQHSKPNTHFVRIDFSFGLDLAQASLARSLPNEKPRYLRIRVLSVDAEEEGFEPPVPCGTTVFKTAAFDHSAIPPGTQK